MSQNNIKIGSVKVKWHNTFRFKDHNDKSHLGQATETLPAYRFKHGFNLKLKSPVRMSSSISFKPVRPVI